MTDAATEHLVEEVRGPALTLVQAWSMIGMGVLALLSTGVISALLGALVDEGRLTEAGVGYAATLEALAMAAAVGIASIALKPERLRVLGIGATLVLVAANLLTIGTSGEQVYWIRTLAGLAEGVLLWFTSIMTVRTLTPARWAALLFLALSIVQVAVSALLGAAVLPRVGGDGGYVLLAIISLAGLAFAVLMPRALGSLPGMHGEARGAPPMRGWIALLATLLYTGATAAVSVYLVPLAQASGLSVQSARLALSVGLGAQILGSALAAWLADRANYLLMFAITTAGYLLVWFYYTLPGATTVPFVAITAGAGVVAMFVSPFLLPMLINADPSRRAALQAPAAQLLSGGMGPFAAAAAVEHGGMTLMLQISAALLLGGFVVMAALHRWRQPAVDAVS